jgi:hypothetical protein
MPFVRIRMFIPHKKWLAHLARQESVIFAVDTSSVAHEITLVARVCLTWDERVRVVDQAGCVRSSLVNSRERKWVDCAVNLAAIQLMVRR